MNDITCECSDEYGPCEDHCEVLVIREGASLRTADDLALVQIADMIDCGAEWSAYGRIEYERLCAQIETDRDPTSGCAWFENTSDASSAHDLAFQIASTLPDRVSIYSDDGYVIVRMSDDCPLWLADFDMDDAPMSCEANYNR